MPKTLNDDSSIVFSSRLPNFFSATIPYPVEHRLMYVSDLNIVC